MILIYTCPQATPLSPPLVLTSLVLLRAKLAAVYDEPLRTSRVGMQRKLGFMEVSASFSGEERSRQSSWPS